ncbi:PTS sugar transporter subunit IIA [Caviibacter abscessus]|uniref:PTS sugar transporter subunit IIA n=1 Tax=Caviibacter abscessus TaxID=1766719 RepID=UPI00083685F7|nr:PTS sugar transporter subunit IIA [Caviibacter abscessus]
MDINEFLTSDRISFTLNSSTKKEIIEEIAKLFLNSDDIVKEGEFNVLLEDLYDRENLSSTGMQDGIAIPHTKSSAINKMAMAVVVSKEGKDFAALDDELSKIFFMIVAPETTKREHLDILAKIAKLSFEEEALQKLINTNDKNEIIEILSKL